MDFLNNWFGNEKTDALIVEDVEVLNSKIKETSLKSPLNVGMRYDFLQKENLSGCRYIQIQSGKKQFTFAIQPLFEKGIKKNYVLTTQDQRHLIGAVIGEKISLQERCKFIDECLEGVHFLKDPDVVFKIVTASANEKWIDCTKLLDEIKSMGLRFINSGQSLHLKRVTVTGQTKSGLPYKLTGGYMNRFYDKNSRQTSCIFKLAKSLQKSVTLQHPSITIDYLEALANKERARSLTALLPPVVTLADFLNQPRNTSPDSCPSDLLEVSSEEEKIPEAITIDFEELGVGGLDLQVETIMREAFLPRMLPKELSLAYGIQATRGMLLYGPPGTGKTSLAQALAKKFNESGGSRKKTVVTVVNGPELLSKWVGESEANIRKKFEEARANPKVLHIIIFDEFDSIAGERNSGSRSHQNSVVGQLLTMMDGVDNSNDNILIIGITNRKDMIDSAILRPGRCGTHVYVGLPSEEGREAIFKVHTKFIRQQQLLASDVDFNQLAKLTNNYTGAEIKSVIQNGVSFASKRNYSVDAEGNILLPEGGQKQLEKVTQADLLQACRDLKPSHGISGKNLEPYLEAPFQVTSTSASALVQEFGARVAFLAHRSSLRPLCWGLFGNSGLDASSLDRKSKFAVHLALASKAPNVIMVDFHAMKSLDIKSRCTYLMDVYYKAQSSALSVLIFQDVPRILGLISSTSKCDIRLIQTLKCILESPLPEGKQMILLSTFDQNSSEALQLLQEFGLHKAFGKMICDSSL